MFQKASGGQKPNKKSLYQYLVQKANSIGGIRKLYQMFKDDRRQLLDRNDPKAKISIDYFKVCAMFIPLLETKRKANLIHIYEKAARDRNKIGKIEFLPLEEISRKIDYEKLCNMGLYGRLNQTNAELLNMSYEDLMDIQDHCNDQVMK